MKKYVKVSLDPNRPKTLIITSSAFNSPLEAAGSLILPGVILELSIVDDKIESIKEHNHGTNTC